MTGGGFRLAAKKIQGKKKKQVGTKDRIIELNKAFVPKSKHTF